MSRCSSSVLTVRGRVGIRRARQHVRLAAHADDVGRMAAAGSLGVIRVNRTPLECGDGIVHEARLVQRVGVNRHLHVVLIGNGEAAIDGRRRRAPVFMQLQPDCACPNLLVKPFGHRAVAFAEKSKVHRQRIGRLQHFLEIPRSGRAGRRLRARRRPGAAADEGRHAARERDVDLLRADVMNVRVYPAGGQDEPFAGNRLGRDADDEVRRDAGHYVGIARFADAGDPAVLHPDVCLVDAGPVDDERVGNHEVERAIVADSRGLTHAVAKHLAAAELALVAIHRVVAFHLGDEIRVGKSNAIACCRAVNVGVVPSHHPVAHSKPPRTMRSPAISTSATVRTSPGSNRTAVPAGMSRRRPVATARSNSSARLVCAKW